MQFLREVGCKVDWKKNRVLVGKYVLPVCKYDSSKAVVNGTKKSVQLVRKTSASASLLCTNTFELLNVENVENAISSD